MKAYLIWLASAGVVMAAQKEKATRTPEEMERNVRLQILLDRANFGPGKIDGHMGDFTRKALDRYRMSQGGADPRAVGHEPAPAIDAANPAVGQTSTQPVSAKGSTSSTPTAASKEAPPERTSSTEDLPAAVGLPKPPSEDGKPGLPAPSRKEEAKREEKAPKVEDVNLDGIDLKRVGEPFIEYTVTEADAETVGELPKERAAQAKLKWLPYTSIAEAVAEKFHMDVDFLEELNRGKTKELKAGDVVRVVNVEPFELATVKSIKPGSAIGQGANAEESEEGEAKSEAKEKADDDKKDGEKKEGEKKEKSSEAKESPTPYTIVVTKGENMLEVLDGDRMIAAFPVTVGSDETASPVGDWKVRGVAKMPEFRYDEKMLKQGERGDKFHLLPPGPNNPVGVMWIGLNRKGIGMHGSDSPDAIGRNVSHGCIRLANWDVVKLASLVKGGAKVTIR